MTKHKKQLPVITLIGAGSQVFAFCMCTDICYTPILKGATVRLVDIDPQKLETMTKLFRLVSQKTGMELHISSTVDRREALPGSDFVVLSVAAERIKRWDIDLALSRKYGMVETQGECGGPGGLSLTLRNIPLILEIARDIEELAPDALLLNFTNPMTRVCLALNKYTKLKSVGLCHGLMEIQHYLSRLVKREISVTGCGINHFNWISDAMRKDSGENIWHAVREAFLQDVSPRHTYGRELCRIFDRIVAPDDGHSNDFIHHWRGTNDGLNPRYPLKPKNMAEYRVSQAHWEERISDYLSGKKDPMADFKGLSGEGAIPIICVMSGLTPAYDEISVNIPNHGAIENLGDRALVEVPARISCGKIEGHRMGALPLGLKSLIGRQLDIAELAVDAAVEGNRDMALQALAIDPIIPDLEIARNYLNDVVVAHQDVLPQFHKM